MASVQSQTQRAIAEISDKPSVPEIDFTQHQLEDGSYVSTQERVIKDVSSYILRSTMTPHSGGVIQYFGRCKHRQ